MERYSSLTSDGKKIVTADFAPEKKSVTVWDAASRKKIRTEKGKSSEAQQILPLARIMD